ncbi:hypothetical protein H5410_022811 [Solanum commersonii]|uniref:Protein kinase domain-containing protein n=1 Tax=Solanum commersonii TaxID=4109 RepID=A0A9J5ZFT1_SOLCO|nr:hypothetical protein H5410_022811 [Solanum commersonii]
MADAPASAVRHDNGIIHQHLKTSNLQIFSKTIIMWLPNFTQQFSTTIDMWSVGCVMAELIFDGKTQDFQNAWHTERDNLVLNFLNLLGYLEPNYRALSRSPIYKSLTSSIQSTSISDTPLVSPTATSLNRDLGQYIFVLNFLPEVPICTFKLVFLFIEKDFQLALQDVPRQVGFPRRRFPGLAYTTNTDYLWAPDQREE